MTRRARFGYPSGEASPSIRIAPFGLDVDTAAPDQLTFDSRFPVASVITSGSISVAQAGSNITHTIFFPALPFVPLVVAGIFTPGLFTCVEYELDQDASDPSKGIIIIRPVKRNLQVPTDENGTAYYYPRNASCHVEYGTNTVDGSYLYRGFQMSAFSNRLTILNGYHNSGCVVNYHILNIGVPV